MQINTDFYGLKTNWKSPSSNCPELKTSSIADPDPTLSTSQRTDAEGSVHAFSYNSETNPGGLASVPLNPSICPWGIGSGSDAFSQKYVYPSIVSGSDTTNFQFKVRTSPYYVEHDNRSYRFFLGSCKTLQTITGKVDGVWNTRYAELSLRTELDYHYIYQRPILEFDYSKVFVVAHVLYIPKNYIDDKESNHTSLPNKSWNLSKFLPNAASPADLDNNYVYGFQFEVKYEGLESTLSLGLFPFDDIEPTDMANGPYYPYGRKYTHYATPFTTTYDTGQVTRCAIGGLIEVNIRDNNQFIDTEKAIYDKNYTETSNLRHYNFPTIGGDEESYVLCNYIRRTSSSVTLVPNTWNNFGRDGILNYVMEQMAYLGFRFKIDVNDSVTYLPEIDANGITTGRYFAPDDPEIENQQNNDWTTDIFEKTPYNPGSVDPNYYDSNTTILNTDTQIPSYFTTPYVMNTTKVIATAEKFYDKIETDFTSDLWSAKTLYTNNPIDAVISLMYFPFHLAHGSVRPQLIITQQQHLVFGAVDMETVADAVLSSSCILDFGKCTYFPNFGVDDFRNYEPYCKGELYIPYCGSVAINPSEFLNRTISVKMIVDLRNGSCLALVFRDNLVIETASGQIGITIPISGLQSQTLASAEIQAKTAYQNSKSKQLSNIAKTAIDLVGSSMTGNVFGMLNNIANQSQISIGDNNLYKSKFELEHIQTPFSVKGSASSATALINEQRCRLILHRPIMLENDLTVFAHQNGFATLEHDSLNNYTGFTMCDTADLSGINCTKSEKNLIMNHLRNGVFL